jgi:hypothetical protein
MKTYSLLLLVAALFAGGCQTTPSNPNPAKPDDVTVTFKDSDKYTDAREMANGPTSQYYLDELAKHLKEQAARRLTAGQKLVVTVTDIDLAGDILPGSTSNIRVIKEIYTPKMNLHFQLLDSAGAVVKEGDRHLTDLNYMQTVMPIVGQNEPLRYDKALITNWVSKEF